KTTAPRDRCPVGLLRFAPLWVGPGGLAPPEVSARHLARIDRESLMEVPHEIHWTDIAGGDDHPLFGSARPACALRGVIRVRVFQPEPARIVARLRGIRTCVAAR